MQDSTMTRSSHAHDEQINGGAAYPVAPIRKLPMQEDAAVAVIRLFLVLSRQALKPASVGSNLHPGLGLVQSLIVHGPPESVNI